MEIADQRSGELGHGRTVALDYAHAAQPVQHSRRVAQVSLGFGVPITAGAVSIGRGASLRLGPGRVILLCGPSGSGKSSALAAVAAQVPAAVDVQQIAFRESAAVIDQVAPQADLSEAASILSACGLGEAALWLRPYRALSEGEKFRARLARAVSLQQPPSGAALLCDEFCSGLHARAARAIAHNVRKWTLRTRLAAVVACPSEDLVPDLNPDAVVRFGPAGQCEVEERGPRRLRAISLSRRLRIEPGSKEDYRQFSAMHYRAGDELGFVDRIFVLREGPGGSGLGIIAYAHGPLELSLRNQATGGWFSRRPERVNDRLRILRRLVIHPDVRGCGLGRLLVRETLPLAGTELVECLAAMGQFNPVFERAGMRRIGQCPLTPGAQAAWDALRAMNVDPCGADFAGDVARRAGVRALVSRVVREWYAATTGQGARRVERQSPEFLARTFRGLIGVRPVYYLWQRPGLQNGSEPVPRFVCHDAKEGT